MIESMYLFLTAVAFFMFFAGVTNLFNLKRETRMFTMFLTFIVLVLLAFSSFNIENTFCELTTSDVFSCTMHQSYDNSMVIFDIMLAIISVIYILAEVFGWMPRG